MTLFSDSVAAPKFIGRDIKLGISHVNWAESKASQKKYKNWVFPGQ
jgi:hypothetical protein